MTRVAFGVPVLNGATHLEEAVGSLLAQTHRDFGLVVMDNCSTDATPEIGRRFAESDPRVRYRRNPETVGMVENWRRAYEAAVEEFGELDYFAFGSDHDVWQPDWLGRLLAELEADERVVLAYPVTVPIRPDGKRFADKMTRHRWDTSKVGDPVTRIHLIARGSLRAGNVAHGLYRARALERCGLVHSTVGADRLLIAQLSVLGRFKQVPEELWMRRFWSAPSAPQRRRMFSGRAPAYSYLPVAVVHAGLLFRWAVVRGRARPAAGRARSLLAVLAYLLGRAQNRSDRRSHHLAERWARTRRKWPKRQRKLRKTARKRFKHVRKGARKRLKESLGPRRRDGRRVVRSARRVGRRVAGKARRVARTARPPRDSPG